MDSRQQTSKLNSICLCLFNKTIRMYYSLFVFRFCYKIIGLSFDEDYYEDIQFNICQH